MADQRDRAHACFDGCGCKQSQPGYVEVDDRGARAEKTDRDRVEELFLFLKGEIPDGVTIGPESVPKLTDKQAWTVVWYLGNQYWAVPDTIERCGVCGEIYDTEESGACLDYGEEPFHFCDGCIGGEVFVAKVAKKPSEGTTNE